MGPAFLCLRLGGGMGTLGPMTNEVVQQVQQVRVPAYETGAVGINPQDLTELGALLAATGYTTLEARALVAEIQQVAAQVAVAMAPKMLEQVRKVQAARLAQTLTQIRILPNMAGYVSRDRVLAIIQSVAVSTPQL